MTSMLYTMSLALFLFLSRPVETKSASHILKPRTPFSRVGKNLSSQLSCMGSKPIVVVVMISPTDERDTEQLNVFGRNLNTVTQTLKFGVIVSIANSDCRSRAKTGSVKGGLRLPILMREQACWYGRKL